MKYRRLSDLITPARVIEVAVVVSLLLLLAASCRSAEAQGLTIAGKGWSVTFWGGSGWYHQPRYCPRQPGWYSPGCNTSPPVYGERGSYSRGWDARTGRWSEYENVRDPSGSYRRSTTCDPRWGCQSEVTRTERFYGPYSPPPP